MTKEGWLKLWWAVIKVKDTSKQWQWKIWWCVKLSLWRNKGREAGLCCRVDEEMWPKGIFQRYFYCCSYVNKELFSAFTHILEQVKNVVLWINHLSLEKYTVKTGKKIAYSQSRAPKQQTIPLSNFLCKTWPALHLAVAPLLKKENMIININQGLDVGTCVMLLLFAGSNQVARLGSYLKNLFLFFWHEFWGCRIS